MNWPLASARHQAELPVVQRVIGELHLLTELQVAVVIPAAEHRVDLGLAVLALAVEQHDARIPALALGIRAARFVGPEVVEVGGLHGIAADRARYRRGVHPALRLAVPAALQQLAIVGQKAVGGAVGVVDDLNAAGGGHGREVAARSSDRRKRLAHPPAPRGRVI